LKSEEKRRGGRGKRENVIEGRRREVYSCNTN